LILKKEADRPNYFGNASAKQNLDIWKKAINNEPLILKTPLNIKAKKTRD
jgi:hypothetical protein